VTGRESISAGRHDPSLRVLQVGPLYTNHLRRWSGHARALGCTVWAAGHLRPGRQPVDLDDLVERVDVAPPELYQSDMAYHATWLRGVIGDVRPDVVQAHWLPRWGCCATHSGHPGVVVTPWGSDVYRGTPAERARAEQALTGASAVLARSPHMLRELLDRGADPRRTHRVDLGVDLEQFRPPRSGERERLRARLGLPDGPVVLSFRAGAALYHLDMVLDAFALLRARVADAALVVAHGPSLSDPLRARLGGLGPADGVHVAGDVPHSDMPRYLRAATVGVSIPGSDGSPNSVWEALACGLPVVLSDLPQLAERVGGSGAAVLVERRAHAVARALHDVVVHPARQARMAQAARAWSVANSDQREQVARLGAVYDAVAKRSSTQAADGSRTAPALSSSDR
jgi:glycosyltransferase involved in cell wall biosynthesis